MRTPRALPFDGAAQQHTLLRNKEPADAEGIGGSSSCAHTNRAEGEANKGVQATAGSSGRHNECTDSNSAVAIKSGTGSLLLALLPPLLASSGAASVSLGGSAHSCPGSVPGTVRRCIQRCHVCSAAPCLQRSCGRGPQAGQAAGCRHVDGAFRAQLKCCWMHRGAYGSIALLSSPENSEPRWQRRSRTCEGHKTHNRPLIALRNVHVQPRSLPSSQQHQVCLCRPACCPGPATSRAATTGSRMRI